MKNFFKHLKLITKHKILVFKLCCKIGEPWRGFMHDFSKYSPVEFWEGVKYYNGERSPIVVCKQKNGYSKAWLHHKGRNKHHSEYWIDLDAPIQAPIIPYKYTAEMICDKLAAGIIYHGKNWTNDVEYNYYMKEREYTKINEKIDKLLIEVFTQVKENGIDKTLTKENIRNLYKTIIEQNS